jgi:hypothetical protein
LNAAFQKLHTLKSCVKVVMALATLAGGLLLIRLCGEKRLQRFLNFIFFRRKYQKNAMTHEGREQTMVSHNVISN